MLIKIKIKLSKQELDKIYQVINNQIIDQKHFLSNGKADDRNQTLDFQMRLQLIEILMKKKMKLTLSGKQDINLSLKYHEAYFLNKFMIEYSINNPKLSYTIIKIDRLL